MLIGTGDVFAQIPQRRAAERVMLAAQAAARRQDGCVDYSFSEVLGDPGHYLLLEQWRDRRSLDAHYRSAPFIDYQRAIAPLLVRETELELHTVSESSRPLESHVVMVNQDDS